MYWISFGKLQGRVQIPVNPFLLNVPFWASLKHQKTKGFLVFSGISKGSIEKKGIKSHQLKNENWVDVGFGVVARVYILLVLNRCLSTWSTNCPRVFVTDFEHAFTNWFTLGVKHFFYQSIKSIYNLEIKVTVSLPLNNFNTILTVRLCWV